MGSRYLSELTTNGPMFLSQYCLSLFSLVSSDLFQLVRRVAESSRQVQSS